MTKKSSSGILVGGWRWRNLREKVKFWKFSTVWKFFENIGGNLKRGKCIMASGGMDAPVIMILFGFSLMNGLSSNHYLNFRLRILTNRQFYYFALKAISNRNRVTKFLLCHTRTVSWHSYFGHSLGRFPLLIYLCTSVSDTSSGQFPQISHPNSIVVGSASE